MGETTSLVAHETQVNMTPSTLRFRRTLNIDRSSMGFEKKINVP
jgi:hypothetical protein